MGSWIKTMRVHIPKQRQMRAMLQFSCIEISADGCDFQRDTVEMVWMIRNENENGIQL